MIDIMTHIHKYVPQRRNGEFVPIFFGGDQLTRERAGGALDARLQGSNPLSRLEGVTPKIEDWHALMCFYQVHKAYILSPNLPSPNCNAFVNIANNAYAVQMRLRNGEPPFQERLIL